MSLSTNISSLVTRIGTEFKTVRTEIATKIGDLTTLKTSAKTNVVSAINEVKDSLATAGAQINDTTASGTTVYSSNKTNSSIAAAVSALVASSPSSLDTLKELADALGDDPNFATTITTALGNRVRVDAAQTFTAAQLTQGQTNLNVPDATAVGPLTTDYVAAFVSALS